MTSHVGEIEARIITKLIKHGCNDEVALLSLLNMMLDDKEYFVNCYFRELMRDRDPLFPYERDILRDHMAAAAMDVVMRIRAELHYRLMIVNLRIAIQKREEQKIKMKKLARSLENNNQR